jgi:formylglycine-generating enzyme required for sulfatase activity
MTKNIRLFNFIIFSTFCLFPFFKGTGAELPREGKALSKEIVLEKRYSLQNYPEFVRVMGSKAKNVYKNQKGFWETEFEDGIIMVYIPSGKFQQGSENGKNNEGPARSAYLGGYWIGKYEVTFDQYDQFCEEQGIIKPDDEGWGREGNPVINISWLDAMAYCRWLSNKIGINFNLPTESHWEKAARGTDGRMYPWGNSLPSDKKANYADRGTNFEMRSSTANDKSNYTTPVGSYPEGSSPYGLLDMAGNVYELCLDLYSSSYSSSSLKKNSREPKKGTYRVLRGGSWYGISRCLRTTFRTSAKPTSRYFHIGFRLCAE